MTFLITQEYHAGLGKAAERVPKLLALGQFIKDTDPNRGGSAHAMPDRGLRPRR